MKILLIDVNCKNSSTGKIVYDLYQRLKLDGHDASICYGRGLNIREKGIFKFGIDFETYLHAALARITGLNGYFSLISTTRLINFIEKFKPEIVHLHELHAYFVNIKQLIKYLNKKKIKIIWTFHCEYMYTGKCGHAYECENWKTKCENCPLLKEYPKSLIFDFTRKMFNDKKIILENLDFTIVTPSNWLKSRVQESFLKNKRIEVIHNGIETNKIFYPRSEKEINVLRKKYNIENKKIILSVAPNIMSESKGGVKILEISRSFIDNDDIHFILIGEAYTKNISSNVTLLRKIDNQHELATWYSLADVFFICSKRETFPTTCLEAMCCGTPIIGIDAGGTKETVPEPYGKFFTLDNQKEMINELRKLVLLKKARESIRRKGCKLYKKEVMYDSYLKLYEEINNDKGLI